MKRLTVITALLAGVMVALAALGALCGAAVTMAQDPLLYGSQSRAAVMDSMGFVSEDEVTSYIGLDWQAQDDLAGRIALTMRLEQGEFNMEELNGKERQHMRDVHGLVRGAQAVSQGATTLAAALAVVIAWTGARGRRRTTLLGILGGLAALAAAGLVLAALVRMQGFDAMFYRFHELCFDNTLWLMDPAEDLLIRMMPGLLFERAARQAVALAAGRFAVTAVLLAGVAFTLGGMIRRQLAKAEVVRN